MGCGSKPVENYRRATAVVDKMLQAVDPAELPIERPTKIGPRIDLGIAKPLGLTLTHAARTRRRGDRVGSQ